MRQDDANCFREGSEENLLLILVPTGSTCTHSAQGRSPGFLNPCCGQDWRLLSGKLKCW